MSKSYYPIIDKYSVVPPSFTEGMARVLDIGRTMTPKIKVKRAKRINRNSYKAIRSYWETVGSYLDNVIDEDESLLKNKGDRRLISH